MKEEFNKLNSISELKKDNFKNVSSNIYYKLKEKE